MTSTRPLSAGTKRFRARLGIGELILAAALIGLAGAMPALFDGHGAPLRALAIVLASLAIYTLIPETRWWPFLANVILIVGSVLLINFSSLDPTTVAYITVVLNASAALAVSGGRTVFRR